MRQPNPERGYLWTFKNNNLWTFMAHWWTFMTKKNKDIYVETMLHAPAQPRKGVFMDIQKINSWTFMAHWWTFLTKKQDIFVQKRITYADFDNRYNLLFNLIA